MVMNQGIMKKQRGFIPDSIIRIEDTALALWSCAMGRSEKVSGKKTSCSKSAELYIVSQKNDGK